MSPDGTEFRKKILSEDLIIKVPIFDDRMEPSWDAWDSFMKDTDEGDKVITFPNSICAIPSISAIPSIYPIPETQQSFTGKNVTLAPNPVSSRPEVLKKDDEEDFLGIKWENVNWKFWTWGEEEIYKEEI